MKIRREDSNVQAPKGYILLSVIRPEEYEATIDLDGGGKEYATIEELAELKNFATPIIAKGTFIIGYPGWYPGYLNGELLIFRNSEGKTPTVTILR